jgi:oligopeptide transport system substrate-binding protein
MLLSVVMLVALVTGCGGGTASATEPPSESSNDAATNAPEGAATDDNTQTAEGSDVYRVLYSSEYTTLNYLITGNTYELKAAANTIDGLTEYDEYGVVQPGLAESWESNADYTVWTFKIRQGVKWVDKDGNEVAEVTANDWVTTAEYVNTAKNDSALQYMYDGIVLNASEYYNQTVSVLDAETAVADGTAASVEEYYTANDIDPAAFITFDAVGVKALDDYTLEYTMAAPIPFFVSVLAYASYLPVYAPFLEEQGDMFGIDNETLLYNGAYLFYDYEPNVQHSFKANPLYWDKDKVFIKEYKHIYNADDLTLGPSMFQRGEIDYAEIGADILANWLENPETKDLVQGSMPIISYSYFYAFNFEPRFDAQYEPDNWITAVNNENFRKSLLHGLDRIKALTVQDPYNPEILKNNTVTPETFAVGAGKDFTQYDALKPISDGESFDETKAVEFRDLAKEELTAAGATFPIKALMPYNPTISNWDKECQVVEQQLEALLGADYIDIIVEAGPSSGFLGEVRRSGKYAFMKCNWGADYADPQTWTDPFSDSNSYNFMYTDAEKVMDDLPATNKTQATQDIVTEYYRLADAAKAITDDMEARFTAFAQAEAYLIDHAVIIPFSVDTEGYRANRLDPFTAQFAPYGLAPFKYKGMTMLETPMNIDAYNAAYEAWKLDWATAQAASEE